MFVVVPTYSTSNGTVVVTSRIVTSAATRKVSSPCGSTPSNRATISGQVAASKKSAERRCSSRAPKPVLMLAVRTRISPRGLGASPSSPVPSTTPAEPTRPTTAIADEPGFAAWRAFLQAHARITRRLDEELQAAHGLSLAEYDALLQIAHSPGRRVRMNVLANRVLL